MENIYGIMQKLEYFVNKLIAMRISILGVFCLLMVCLHSNAQLTVHHLLTNNRINPIGVDDSLTRFSWQLSGNYKNIRQQAYQITVYDAQEKNATVWFSGKVNSSQSVMISVRLPKMIANKRYSWKVQVWDEAGNTSISTEAAFFQIGLFHASNWKAQWIEASPFADSIGRPSPLFRKTFPVNKKVTLATAYITAHGLYEAYINGKRVGDGKLTPGWTVYAARLPYQAYDVTQHLQKGLNACGVMVGSGWYRGYIGFSNQKNFYGTSVGLLMQIHIQYEDGSSEILGTDNSWTCSTGEVRYAELYNGETIDHTKTKAGFSMANYDAGNWQKVIPAQYSLQNLVATENELITQQEVIKPIKLMKTPAGETVIDFGQNLVGWVAMSIKGKTGDSIKISHAEVLDKQGNFYTDNLRAARAVDVYVLKGGEQEFFEPHFTFHGFRYIKIEGNASELKPEQFEAKVLHSNMPVTGTFSTSNELINQLQHNILWGQKGNFLDVPTDCPQRDERLGWTGDAQVFSRTAAYNMNVHNFFSKWLKDLAADQLADGAVPFVIPNVLGNTAVASAGWADAATIIPWNMFLAYGDTQLLRTQFPSMKKWVNYMKGKSKDDLWNTGFHFGDWLFYRPEDDNDGRAAVTDKYLIAQCFYAHSIQLLIQSANVLGLTEEVTEYTRLLERVVNAFQQEYVTPSGRLVSSTQTAYVLSLQFNMLPVHLRKSTAERLAENIRSYGIHLTTGFLGTPYLCEVLTRFGYTSLAYQLLLQETYPSWLYPVKMGATTIWERWDGIKQNGTFQTPGMNSFNHYAYGAIGDWMYRTMAGIKEDEAGAGYKKIIIQPQTGGNFSKVSATLQTYYGLVSSSWQIQQSIFQLDVEIPANTTAVICLPTPKKGDITESGSRINISNLSPDEFGNVKIPVGSGKYHFEIAR